MKSKYFHSFLDKDLVDILTKEEAISLKKISNGKANEYEQRVGYKAIIEKICRINAPSFHINQNIANFNEGVRWVGVSLALLVPAPSESFKDDSPIKT